MTRRRSTPWIYLWSRTIIASVATLGFLNTGYLTFEKLTGSQVACNSSCDIVLSSPYASVMGLPLSLLGCIAYFSVIILALSPLLVNYEKNRNLRNQLEEITWILLLIGSSAMAVFSLYLMFVLATAIKVVCPYCIGSAVLSLSLLFLTIKGRDWPELGQIIITIFTVGIITLLATLGIYSNVNGHQGVPPAIGSIINKPTTYPEAPHGWEIKTVSGPAEISLAEHLDKIGAKMYGAWWCPHCFDQKQLFGKAAFQKLPYVECAPEGINPNPDACIKAKVESFPTWVINGKIYSGTTELQQLAKYSGYQGPSNFIYKMK
jgi:uncharacterized membrane protein